MRSMASGAVTDVVPQDPRRPLRIDETKGCIWCQLAIGEGDPLGDGPRFSLDVTGLGNGYGDTFICHTASLVSCRSAGKQCRYLPTLLGHGRTINSEFSVWRGVVDGQAKNRHAGIRQPRSPLHPHAQLDGIRQYQLIDPARPCHHLRSQEWPDRFQMTGRRRNRRAVSPRMACR